MPIVEFPGIRIDDFALRPNEPASCLCFLTHMHEDHTSGLARKSYYGPHVYCTAATRALLLNFRTNAGTGELKYNHLRQEVCGKEIVKALELDKPYEMEYKQTKIQVTLIDANHCPGAAMILIQPLRGHGTSVLFTGDLRCEKWHLDSLRHHPALLPYLRKFGRPRPLSVYLDNTFESHANPYKAYPKNHSGIKSLLKLLDSYPQEVQFCLADRVTGYEEVLIAVAQHLDSLIHMDAYHYNLYMLAADTSPLAAKLLRWCTVSDGYTVNRSENGSNSAHKPVRIHYCQKNFMCPSREPHAATAYFKPCNQPTSEIVERQNRQFPRNSIPPGIMVEFAENPRVVRGPDQRYYLDEKTNAFYPLFPWFYFSRHASFPEIKQLCETFNTCSIRSLDGEPLLPSTPLKPVIANSVNSQYDKTNSSSSQLNSSEHANSIEHADSTEHANSTEHTNSTARIHSSLISVHLEKDGGVEEAKHVLSMIGGEVTSDEFLPVIKKRKMIALHQDRVRMQKARERADNYQRRHHNFDSEHELSSLNSEDEEENHRALMALGHQNKKRAEHSQLLQASIANDHCEAENNDTGPIKMAPAERIGMAGPYQPIAADCVVVTGPVNEIRDVPQNNTQKSLANEAVSESHIEDDDEATLPSPPSSPGVDCVDETLTESEQLEALVNELRHNPQHWFGLPLDCLNRITIQKT